MVYVFVPDFRLARLLKLFIFDTFLSALMADGVREFLSAQGLSAAAEETGESKKLPGNRLISGGNHRPRSWRPRRKRLRRGGSGMKVGTGIRFRQQFYRVGFMPENGISGAMLEISLGGWDEVERGSAFICLDFNWDLVRRRPGRSRSRRGSPSPACQQLAHEGRLGDTPRFQIRQRRNPARTQAALPHTGRAASQRGRPRG